jgi:hypothetical protein
MTVYSEQKRLAQAANAVTGDVGVDITIASKTGPSQSDIDAVTAFMGVATPAVFLAMITDIEALASLLKRFVDGEHDHDEDQNDRHHYHGEAQTLLSRLGGEFPEYSLVPNEALYAQRQEILSLRSALVECAGSLDGEMLQKYHGQKPEDMHPVTRRQYDQDRAEVASYIAISKGVKS